MSNQGGVFVSLLQEAQLGRLGSRFSLNFRPLDQVIYLSPMGRFYDQPVELGIGLRLNGQTHILPFARVGEGVIHFQKVTQEFLVEGLEFRVRDAKLGIEFGCKIYAPFYPGDRKISVAPFFYFDLSVRSFLNGRKSFAPLQGEWFLSLSGVNDLEVQDKIIKAHLRSKVDPNCWYFSPDCRPQSKSAFSEGVFQGELAIAPLDDQHWNIERNITNVCFLKSFVLGSAHQTLNETLIIAAYQAGPVLKAQRQEHNFLYTAFFEDCLSVLDFARNNREELLKKTDLFTGTIYQATIGEASKSLISCGFHNYLANTWWVIGSQQEDRFFVWEGWCGFHSTLDVEYNNSWFAILYWPELLEKQLDAWYANIQPEGFPSHDIGILLEVNEQAYPHHMPVEQSCNLILLTYVIWRMRGYLKWRDHLPEMIKIVNYLLNSDTTGNGYPNIGVANTVDDGDATVQYAKEQTYLAVKVLAALSAFTALTAELPVSKGSKSLLARISEMTARIKNTMEKEAWVGDHYAVCLPQSGKDLYDVWTGKQLDSGELFGWDAYSLYTANGLLWLLATGLKPDLDYNRLITDLQKSMKKSLTLFGCTHSNVDRSNVWLSQNMWRDQIAAYLGIDYSSMSERYWRFLEWENTQGRGGCFVDTYGWNWLSYYPRGITAFGTLAASIGMQVNIQQQTIELFPIHCPCKFPLVIVADWQNGMVPWVEFWIDNGELLWRLEGRLPAKWRIIIHSGRALVSDYA